MLAAVTASQTLRSFVPRCPFHELTGRWCPGCGLTRGVAALIRGDVGAAIGFNIFTPIVVALVAAAWAAWMWPDRVRTLRTVQPTWWKGLAGAVLVFTIARNLPGPTSALAP